MQLRLQTALSLDGVYGYHDTAFLDEGKHDGKVPLNSECDSRILESNYTNSSSSRWHLWFRAVEIPVSSGVAQCDESVQEPCEQRYDSYSCESDCEQYQSRL